jgi:prepilin-type processing-associated H-X9-DG protein
LGYTENGTTHGPRKDDESNASMPLVADRPPYGIGQGAIGNSPNHNGWGQNVLYQDGHAGYWKTRNVGYAGDDIYLNKDLKVGAGKDRRDSVLGGSAAQP